MFVIEVLLLIIPMLMGVALLAAAKVLNEKIILTSVGAIIGLAMFITVSYIASILLPASAVVTAGLLVIAALVTIGVVTYTNAWQHWYAQPLDTTGLVVALLLIILCTPLALKLLVVEKGGLYTGVLNAWGDLAWHMSNITNFAEGQSVPPENPIFAGSRLTYPFLVNFFSGQLLTVGASYVRSVVLPAFFLLPLAGVLWYGFVRELTSRKLAAVIAVLLLFLAGGTLGWLRLVPDWHASGETFTAFVQHLPRDYTGSGGDTDGFHFLNPILSLFLPQRSFLFGIPLALAILTLLVSSVRREAAFVLAGITAGLLPLFHGHTVLALILPIIALAIHDGWVVLRQKKTATDGVTVLPLSWVQMYPWLLFVLLAAIVGIPEVLYYLSGSGEGASFFRWGPRWMAGEENLVWYWFKNTGLVLPVAIAGLFLPGNRRLKLIAGAGIGIFVIANLFLFAPWAWDNSKLFIFWLLLSLPIVSAVAARGLTMKNIIVPIIVVLVLLGHGISGGIDLIKTAWPGSNLWGEWDADAIAIAAKIKQVTPPGSIVLTAPYHNTPVALAGRRMYLGFPGHVWSHGGAHWEREAMVQPFYEGTAATLPDVQPQFVLVGPVEQQRYPALVIRPDWQIVASSGSQTLYRLP